MSLLSSQIEKELEMFEQVEAKGDLDAAFSHLERAHVLGQSSTIEHTRVHWRMLKLALKMKSPREVFGQMIRIIGAATKTPLGIYPRGNTGGANVWFFKTMPIPDDLREILDKAKMDKSN